MALSARLIELSKVQISRCGVQRCNGLRSAARPMRLFVQDPAARQWRDSAAIRRTACTAAVADEATSDSDTMEAAAATQSATMPHIIQTSGVPVTLRLLWLTWQELIGFWQMSLEAAADWLYIRQALTPRPSNAKAPGIGNGMPTAE